MDRSDAPEMAKKKRQLASAGSSSTAVAPEFQPMASTVLTRAAPIPSERASGG